MNPKSVASSMGVASCAAFVKGIAEEHLMMRETIVKLWGVSIESFPLGTNDTFIEIIKLEK